MPAQVGNEAARDPVKHSLAYIIRAAVGEVVPSAGPIISIHYDKRGAKVSVQYAGADCADAREKVEALANSLCEQNLAVDQIKLLGEDLDGLKSSDAVKSTGDTGGVTIKKFTVNAAKEQLILEFNIGSAKKKEGEPESKASVGGKAKAAPANTKKPARAGVCPYDSIPEVTDQIVEDVLALLKEQGVSVEGKEAALRTKLADGLQTPLTLLKNTAYTRGFKSHITQPVSNFVVKR